MNHKTSTSPERKGQVSVTDTRIVAYHDMPSPLEVVSALPNNHADQVASARAQICDVLDGKDDRLLLVIGPCSIHDPKSAMEYAGKLSELATKVDDDLLVVMRVYFEKPRTSVGWKGLINDPYLDESFNIRDGLFMARKLLLDIADTGLPCGTEFLDTAIPQYTSDCLAWAAIGARTTESQIHRQLASGLSCPVGFKNATDGRAKVAVDAILSSRDPHRFLAVTPNGSCAIAETTGNNDTHIILRGGQSKPNYDATSVEDACTKLRKAKLAERLMVDCSHANSEKDHLRQMAVAEDIGKQLESGERRIVGVMVESNLVEGKQPLGGELEFGKSVTDACLGWEQSATLVENLASAASRRNKKG